MSVMFPLALLGALAVTGALAIPAQAPFQLPVTAWGSRLQGRMLHITDMHPDPYYVPHTSKKKACHRKRKGKGSGYYGTPNAECDSPLTLTNFTLDYLEANWADEIDFVVWTGDNARHNNDEKIPRTPEEIKDLNVVLATRMKEIFHDRGIPVVPSIGNNDIWPHNIMAPGPNEITDAFARIWEIFIPREHMEVFRQGAYFSTEVIPSKVAVISLNTMYFYDSNDAVNGCPYNEPHDSGNLHFNWLETQLETFRNRDMQVWLIGHVPPSTGNYYPECYVRYVDIALRYQDTILGHLFGHMNVDFFFFLEQTDLQIISEDETITSGHEGLFYMLMNEFSSLPGPKEKVNLDDYAVINVSPSVVPNPYVPAFRVYSYNVTRGAGGQERKFKKRKHGRQRGDYGDKETECSKEEWRGKWKCHLNGTQHSDPESPSRSNQQWTPLGYAQYYIPELGQGNERQEPVFELEYVTFKQEDGDIGQGYDMEDLTIGSWVKLAQRLGHGKEKEMRRRFRRHMYVGQG